MRGKVPMAAACSSLNYCSHENLPGSKKWSYSVMSVDGPSTEGLEKRTVRVLITGRVQGVCFRTWTESTASALGLSGWVRNRRDGAVEALFSGAADRVGEMLGHCRQGPPAALVEEVAAVEETGAPPAGFAILPTA
jgi:acylphosphatase